MRVIVEILSGARAGERLELSDPPIVRFGRHPSAEVAFDPRTDLDASSRHAELRREKGGYVLYDLNSANGTRLADGTRLTRRPLEGGEEIEFGAGGPRCRLSFSVEPDTLRDGPSAPPAPRPTTLLRALAASSSRSFRFAVGGMLVALAGCAFAIFALLHHPARSEDAIRRELVKTMDEQRAANTEALQQKLDELNRELERARAAQGGRQVAQSAREGVYLVAVRGALGQEEGFCTAFAVAAHELATNAHCVVLADSLRRRGARVLAVRNGDGRARYEVTSMRKSAGYVAGRTAITPDVGLLHVDGELPTRVPLADAAALRQLAPGDVIFSYGFPGRLADTSSPEATFVQGVIGRITRLDGEAGDPADRYLIQHSAYTAGGTSGSPIFDASGRVVAVNAGGYVEDDPLEVRDPRSGHPGQVVVAQPLTGYNFGMRIDLLDELLRDADPSRTAPATR